MGFRPWYEWLHSLFYSRALDIYDAALYLLSRKKEEFEMPKDPVMLLSYINTMLRDKSPSLKELCTSENADMEHIKDKLQTIDYRYDKALNRFV